MKYNVYAVNVAVTYPQMHHKAGFAERGDATRYAEGIRNELTTQDLIIVMEGEFCSLNRGEDLPL